MATFSNHYFSTKSDEEILELDYSTATNDGNDSIKIETVEHVDNDNPQVTFRLFEYLIGFEGLSTP